jgi:hypothetical protein
MATTPILVDVFGSSGNYSPLRQLFLEMKMSKENIKQFEEVPEEIIMLQK